MFVSTGIGNIEEINAASQLLVQGKRYRFRNALRASLSPFFVPRILNNLPASNIALRFGFRGPCVSNNMACASSAYSILEGLSAIRSGICDAAVVGGTESCIGPIAYHGFGSMHALCSRFNEAPSQGARPFDKRRCGFVMGEGSTVLLLETYERARSRSAPILISMLVIGGSYILLRDNRRKLQ